ncbi:MAG: hypothetical protein K6C41_01760 [Lachnospiraceae bacterium]|nr:hypothetical protein [Lachnospiraceae bacterium]
MTVMDKFRKKIDSNIVGNNSAKMNVQEITELLEKIPNAIVFLYRLVDTNNFADEDCEPLCEFLLDNCELFDKIPTLTRAGEDGRTRLGWKLLPYRKTSRDGYPDDKKLDKQAFDKKPLTEISEKRLAMRIFTQGRQNGKIGIVSGLGYILDYEMPIGGGNHLYLINSRDKFVKGDTYGLRVSIPGEPDILFTAGNCDLIAYNDEKLTILELKKPSNEEPLVRAILEAYTYKRLLNTDKAAESLKDNYKEILCNDKMIKWRAAPLLFIEGKQHNEFVTINKKPALRRLMKKLDINPIWYDIDDKNKIKICD